MKFGDQLRRYMVPEWRTKYLEFNQLKQWLKEMPKSMEGVDPETYDQFEKKFFDFCSKELRKVEFFFKQRLVKEEEMYESLRRRFDESGVLSGDKVGKYKIGKLKFAIPEFYFGLILLQNYQQVNESGFRKILKKHDKLLRTDTGEKWMRDKVRTSVFVNETQLMRLLKLTEQLMTELEGDRHGAMEKLRVGSLHEREQYPWTTYFCGLFSGLLIAALTLIGTRLYTGGLGQIPLVEVPLFRAWFIMFFHLLLVSFNMEAWRSNGVNYVLIFELDPRSHLTCLEVMLVAAVLLFSWALAFFLYLNCQENHRLYAHVVPLVILLLLLLNPFNYGFLRQFWGLSSRLWLLKRLRNFIPVKPVVFGDFWMADQLTSLGTVLSDLASSICFYASCVQYKTTSLTPHQTCDVCGPASPFQMLWVLVAMLPFLIRGGQCLRRVRGSANQKLHWNNCFKYWTALQAVLMRGLSVYVWHFHGVFLCLWLFCALVAFLALTSWDLCVDWGLFASKRNCLRNQLIYRHPTYYYAAILIDVMLRLSAVFIAVLQLLFPASLVWNEVSISASALLDSFRRFVWNFLHLENEHLNNCSEFRVHRDIGIKLLTKEELDKKKLR